MNLDEQKLAVCEKVTQSNETWRKYLMLHAINWPTEGLQICHEASKGFDIQLNILNDGSWKVILIGNQRMIVSIGKDLFTTWLDALCRVWWPERFV
jgi:hypothetical protein